MHLPNLLSKYHALVNAVKARKETYASIDNEMRALAEQILAQSINGRQAKVHYYDDIFSTDIRFVINDLDVDLPRTNLYSTTGDMWRWRNPSLYGKEEDTLKITFKLPNSEPINSDKIHSFVKKHNLTLDWTHFNQQMQKIQDRTLGLRILQCTVSS